MSFSDEYLEYWSAVFGAARLLEQGIPFQEFLKDPWGYLKWPGQQPALLSLACGCRHLLPRQVKVARALWRWWKPEIYGSGLAIPDPDERLALVEEEGSEP